MPTDTPRHFAIDCQLDYELVGDTDFVFQIHVAEQGDQTLLAESLDVEAPGASWRIGVDPITRQRKLRVRAGAGRLGVRYRAQVAVEPRHFPSTGIVDSAAVADLPDELLPYLLPTRYCESDLLAHAAWKLFGHLPPGEARVRAIVDWAHDNIEFLPGWSISTTTARDVFVRRAGVCRDFTHLTIALCRGLNIPARLVAGYAPFDDNEAPDFHAVLEAWVGGRWLLFDATRMSPVQDLVRIAEGSDAKDVAFCTIFGGARMLRMSPTIERVAAPAVNAAAPAAAAAALAATPAGAHTPT
jgi:transglutaminase-like putative cysteine protease